MARANLFSLIAASAALGLLVPAGLGGFLWPWSAAVLATCGMRAGGARLTTRASKKGGFALPDPKTLYRAAALIEALAWSCLIWRARPLGLEVRVALSAVVAALAFCRLGDRSLELASAFLASLPMLLAEGVVLVREPQPGAAPLTLGWLALCVLGIAGRPARAGAVLPVDAPGGVPVLSEKQLRILFDTVTVGIVVTRAGIIEDCNAEFLRMLGYEREDLVGRDCRVLLLEGNDQSDEQLNQGLGQAPAATTYRAKRRRRDGGAIDVKLTLGFVPLSDRDDLVVSVYEDVTQALHTEHELRISRERLRLALDALQSGVWDVDLTEGRYFLSRRFKSILGYPDRAPIDRFEGRLFFHHAFVHADDRQRVSDARMAILLEGAPFDEQYRVEREGRLFWVRETVLALCDKDGVPCRLTGSITDTTTINQIQEQLQASEAFHRNLIEASNALIWCADQQGVVTFVNERGARELYGYEAAQMIGRPYHEFVAPESQERLVTAMTRPLRDGAGIRNLELVHHTAGPQRVFVSVNAVPMVNALGVIDGVMGIATDITHLKKRERAFQDATRLQKLIFDSAGEGIVLVRNQRIYRANQAFADLVGNTIGDLVARPLAQCFVDTEQWDAIEAELNRVGTVVKTEQQLVSNSGAAVWLSVTGRRADMAEHGAISIWVCADISASRADRERSWHRAHHDELTGLANRRLFQDQLELALARACRDSTRAALLMIDLDGFKAVNDTHGHACGDEVLKEVANRLADSVRALDIAARTGGDEFVVILQEIDDEKAAESMARRLLEEIARPIRLPGKTVAIAASIGIAMFSRATKTPEALLQSADLAMYEAKAEGRGRFRFALQEPQLEALGPN